MTRPSGNYCKILKKCRNKYPSKKHWISRKNTVLIQVLIVAILIFLLAGCFGPLISQESARTVGKGHNGFKLIASNAGYGFKYDHGFAEDFDVGYSLETYSTGISAKYAFLNNASGPALGGKIGYGTTLGGHYTMGSLLASYKTANWEPFLNLQYNSVQIDSQEVKDANTGDVFATTPTVDYNYTQAFLGMKYWFSPRFAISIEASDFISSNDVEIKGNIVSISADLAY